MAITLKEVIKIIEAGDWLNIKFITADVKKGTGGKVITIPKCRLCKLRLTSLAIKETGSLPSPVRLPNHNLHFTRNLELPNKQIRKVHPILIFSINNQPVL